MNWYKTALFDSDLSGCGAWISKGIGVEKTCVIQTDDGKKVLVQVSADDLYTFKNVFQTPEALAAFQQEYPGVLEENPDALEVLFTINGNVSSDARNNIKGRGKNFQVMAIVVNVLTELVQQQNPSALFFTAFKDDSSAEARADVYTAIIKRKAEGMGYVHVPNGSHHTFLLIKQSVLDNPQSLYDPDDGMEIMDDIDPDFYEPTDEELNQVMNSNDFPFRPN